MIFHQYFRQEPSQINILTTIKHAKVITLTFVQDFLDHRKQMVPGWRFDCPSVD